MPEAHWGAVVVQISRYQLTIIYKRLWILLDHNSNIGNMIAWLKRDMRQARVRRFLYQYSGRYTFLWVLLRERGNTRWPGCCWGKGEIEYIYNSLHPEMHNRIMNMGKQWSKQIIMVQKLIRATVAHESRGAWTEGIQLIRHSSIVASYVKLNCSIFRCENHSQDSQCPQSLSCQFTSKNHKVSRWQVVGVIHAWGFWRDKAISGHVSRWIKCVSARVWTWSSSPGSSTTDITSTFYIYWLIGLFVSLFYFSDP